MSEQKIELVRTMDIQDSLARIMAKLALLIVGLSALQFGGVEKTPYRVSVVQDLFNEVANLVSLFEPSDEEKIAQDLASFEGEPAIKVE
jgi:sulfite exporter TauE/SafE